MVPTFFAMNPTAAFARAWAKATVAERRGDYLRAALWFECAARHAASAVEAELALASAWINFERAQGRVSELELCVDGMRPPTRLGPDGHLGAAERDDDGYGFGV